MKNQTKIRCSVSGVFLIATLFLASCKIVPFLCAGEVQSEAEIAEIATKELDKFNSRQYSDKPVTDASRRINFIEAEKIWVVDYNGKDQFVRFVIDHCGSIETSFGPSERITRIE